MSDSNEDGRFAIHQRLLRFRRNLDRQLRYKISTISYRAEHYGFIAIAAVDAFNLHSFLFAVSIWLLITGAVAEFFHVGGFK